VTEPAPATEPFGAFLAPCRCAPRASGSPSAWSPRSRSASSKPGQRLPTERDLSATLEVSRTTVREALQRLQAAGYVTTRRGRGGGTFIQTGAGPGSDEMIKRTLGPAWDELTELLDYRRLIEQQIARTAAERRSADDVETIRRAVGEYARASGRDASRLADHALHQAIARGHAQLPPRSTCPRGSAARSASASTPNRTRPRCAAGRCGSIPPSPRRSSPVIPTAPPGWPTATSRSPTTTLAELRARLHLRSGGDTDARSQG
jgi:DNA-binding transcriptional regulator YhcF (GntR family)